jgi:hypothetical protein
MTIIVALLSTNLNGAEFVPKKSINLFFSPPTKLIT